MVVLALLEQYWRLWIVLTPFVFYCSRELREASSRELRTISWYLDVVVLALLEQYWRLRIVLTLFGSPAERGKPAIRVELVEIRTVRGLLQ